MRESHREAVTLWSDRRLAYGLLPAVTWLKRQGVDADALLERSGIARFGLLDPSYTISIERELAFLTLARAAVSDPHASLALAKQYHLRGFSVLGLAMQASDTPLEILRLIERYPRLAWGCFSGRMIVDQHCLRLQFAPQPRLGDAEGFLAERDLACALTLLREAMGVEVKVSALSFRHPCQGDPAAYQAFFGCPVRFGAADTSLAIALDWVLRPLPQADPMICAFYSAQCERMARDMDQPFRYQDAVRTRLASHARLPGLRALAAEMLLTPRTLQRRLKQEGRAYSDILQQVREQRARQLLRQSTLSLDQIAESLGFSEAVAFSHAFKQWTGESPGAWRRTADDHD